MANVSGRWNRTNDGAGNVFSTYRRQKWLEQGIQGVPTFVINNREMISGAQESDTLANLILRSVR